MELKNTSKHRPGNMIIDVGENEGKALLMTGEFIETIKENLIVKNKKEVENAEHQELKNEKKYVLDKKYKK